MGAQITAWWGQLWPNLLASVLWGAPGFTIHHVLTRRHVTAETDRQTEQLKAHIDAAAAGAAPGKDGPA